MLTGNILITGGAGYLGRAIMARAKKDAWPCEFTVYSRDELKQHECRLRYPHAQYVLGDIRDTDRLELAMLHQDIVIHAAALKYVPESEFNVAECISINVGGTKAVALAAGHSKSVKTVVLISTDKAVEPINTYGLTKALAERVFREYSRLVYDTKYACVRYGNVVGSTGSVVPVFQRMATDKGRVSVTDPAMTRFWISADDAIDLILVAVNNAGSGCITIPTPKAMSLGELVTAVVPNTPVDIIGPRPGEKHHEKLLSAGESAKTLRMIDMHVYSPDSVATRRDLYELTSDHAERLSVAEFQQLVLASNLI